MFGHTRCSAPPWAATSSKQSRSMSHHHAVGTAAGKLCPETLKRGVGGAVTKTVKGGSSGIDRIRQPGFGRESVLPAPLDTMEQGVEFRNPLGPAMSWGAGGTPTPSSAAGWHTPMLEKWPREHLFSDFRASATNFDQC